jgi:hypothetical protein
MTYLRVVNPDPSVVDPTPWTTREQPRSFQPFSGG